MARKKLIDTVEDTAQVAAKKASEAFVEAAERLAPLIDQAAEYVGPIAEEAGRVTAKVASDTFSRVKPVLHDAQVRGARLASDAYDRVQPTIDNALQAVPPVVDSAVGRVRPAVDDVLERIPPLVEDARSLVQDDVLPKMASALKDIAKQPLAAEAAAQLALATAVVSKELRKAEKARKRSWPKTFGKLILAGALLGGIVVAIRKLLAPPNDGWHTHSPADAYVADPTEAVHKVAEGAKQAAEKVADVAEDVAAAAADKIEDAKDAVADLADDAKDAAGDALDAAKDLAGDAKEAVEDAAEKAVDKAEDVVDDVKEALDDGDDAAPFADSPFGEESFQGSEPPEGYQVKANSRSRKYRVPGSAGYDGANADVWFASSEAAEAAGFTQAKR
ncbi:MAG: DUF5324 family protein [Propionibacteriaceae bacterium]|nr:DUF5324 family protein [Propionibacteriaceae bacterium]